MKEFNRENIGSIAYNDIHYSLEEAFDGRVSYSGLPLFPMLIQLDRIEAGLNHISGFIPEDYSKLECTPKTLYYQIELLLWAVAGLRMALDAAHDSMERSI